MVEAFQEHDLGPDVDEEGNLHSQIADPIALDEAIWKMDKDQSARAAEYIDLKQKIEDLPKFEKTEVKTMILDFLSGEMTEHGETYKQYGIVQYFGGSGQPLSYWEQCTFNTADGKFEEYLNRVRSAVEGMLHDSNVQNGPKL